MKSRQSIPGLIILTALLFLVTACSTPPRGDPRVTIDSSLRNTLQVVTIDSVENNGGTLTFQLALRNKSRSSVGIRYKVEWLLDDGRRYPTVLSNWKSATVMGREIYTLQEVAPNPEIQSFRIQIRND